MDDSECADSGAKKLEPRMNADGHGSIIGWMNSRLDTLWKFALILSSSSLSIMKKTAAR
jgi:hypothetical protein